MENRGPFEGDQLHTVAEVADHMRVSNMTVYRLIKAGEMPAVRVGKSYRIRRTDLQEYLQASRTVTGDVEGRS
jgi:excisionase family DNA binding protein